jgi:hypothetical protein
MALEDLLKGSAARTMGLAVAAAAVTYALLPVVKKAGQPLARAAYKTGVVFYDKARETVAEIGEIMEDLVAEMHPELEEESEELASEEPARSAQEAAAAVTEGSKKGRSRAAPQS